MLRSLTERLPVMVCPRWITTRLQPLAECDLLDYLAGSLIAPPGIYEIGTPDVTDYGAMMRCYAEARGLRPRRIFTVPFVTPSLSARWVDLVSPVDRRISHVPHTRAWSMRCSSTTQSAPFAAFGITPLPVREAVVRAISGEGERVSAGLLDRSPSLGTGVYAIDVLPGSSPIASEAARNDLAQVGGNLSWYGAALGLGAARWCSAGSSARISGSGGPSASLQERRSTGGRWCRADPDHLVLASVGWFCGDGWLAFRITDAPPAWNKPPHSGPRAFSASPIGGCSGPSTSWSSGSWFAAGSRPAGPNPRLSGGRHRPGTPPPVESTPAS